MYRFGGHGVDVKLYDMSCSDNITWVNGNSYVRVAVPETATEHDRKYRVHRNVYGEEYYIYSVNGIGEIRWDINNHYDLNQPENATVAEYFNNRRAK